MNRKMTDFLFGKTEFMAENGFCEEFLKSCRNHGVVVYDLKMNGMCVSGYVNYTDRSIIADLAESNAMTFSVVSRYGLPYLFLRYRKRYGIPAGLFAFTLIIVILNSFLWSIEISGLDTIPKESIVNLLTENGVAVGSFTETIDCKETEYLLYSVFDDISWVNVHIIGSRMFIDISEVCNKEETDTPEYTNIVASKDGEIILAEIFTGEGKFYPGTAVVKGDLLVSGVINRRNGSVKFVDSEAKIYARTRNFISSFISEKLRVKSISECKDIYLLNFFGISLPLGFAVKQDDFTINKYFADGNNIVLPLGTTRKFSFEMLENEINLSAIQAQLICMRDFSLSALKLYKDAEIISRSIAFSETDITEICGEFLCIEDIAQKKIFTVEEA